MLLMPMLDGMGISSTNIYEIDSGSPFTIYDLKMHLLGNRKTNIIPAFNGDVL
ncbi:hypothetical protein C8N40_11231 [Pontibacter mucosus]|uniref:Uncharacterized protein n=1 Tax=Pontibacter mucosus TaxID=1649266 RepID=A0A2T5YCI1_9BACT|nr:hypothetical protein [Pontibacter mucosus]PTX14184.1 hypothetical protein C8N40_11231 [Pontibacter mucosus]